MNVEGGLGGGGGTGNFGAFSSSCEVLDRSGWLGDESAIPWSRRSEDDQQCSMPIWKLQVYSPSKLSNRDRGGVWLSKLALLRDELVWLAAPPNSSKRERPPRSKTVSALHEMLPAR